MADVTISLVDDTVSDAGETDMTPQIVSKPNTTSKIWRYFGLVVDASGKPNSSDADAPVCPLKSIS